MRSMRLVLMLLWLIAIFCGCLLFVVSNPAHVSVDLLVASWQPQLSLGGLLLFTLLLGVLLGWLAAWAKHQLRASKD